MAEWLISLSVLALAGVLGLGAHQFPADKGYSILGPHVFAWAVTVLVAGLGLGLLWQTSRGGFANAPTAPSLNPNGLKSLLWIAAGLLLNAALINLVGFVLSSALLFTLAAHGFGSRRPLRDALIGLGLVLPVFWLFTRALGLNLPSLINSWI